MGSSLCRRLTAVCAGGMVVFLACGDTAPAQTDIPASSTVPGSESTINFSFDRVDITTFVKLIGDITGRKFVVAEGVTGKITVVSPVVQRREVYPLFVSILESAGCSVIQEGEIYRVVPLPKRETPVAPVVGVNQVTPASGIITKVISLKHVTAGELRKVLESKVSGGKAGAIASIDETNHLLLTDTAESIRRIEQIVSEIDKPGLARVTEVVPLEFAAAEELAVQLTMAMAEGDNRAEVLRNRLPAVPGTQSAPGRTPAIVVPSPHSNSLILVGNASQIGELRKLVKQMDVDTRSGRGRLNAIFLKYISAEEASKSINSLLIRAAGPIQPGSTPKLKISIEANTANNALLVEASPSDFDAVKKLVDQLDQAPQQVQISVVIAEISERGDLNFGVEIAAIDSPSAKGDTVGRGGLTMKDTSDNLMNMVQNSLFPRGLTFAMANGARTDSKGDLVIGNPGVINIDAMKKDTRFKIRSTTDLVAQNNKEASVNIVNQYPILKSTVSSGTGTTRDIIQNIDRMDVGIKLKLTPQIIENAEVRMMLSPSIEAVVDPGPQGTQFAPTIARREVSTTVTVPDGRTIVIAGLTREDKTRVVKKFPLLGSLPLVGWIFRSETDSKEVTNLLIFVTPQIVSDAASAKRAMDHLEGRTGLKANEQK